MTYDEYKENLRGLTTYAEGFDSIQLSIDDLVNYYVDTHPALYYSDDVEWVCDDVNITIKWRRTDEM